jgi:hypothetical protein
MRQRRLPLGKGARKGFLVAHIASSGIWIGMDIVMGILVFAALTDAQPAAATYQALRLFAVWPLLIIGVICFATGVVLSLGSKYGLVRYWWVAVKLGLNVVLCLLVLFALRPGLQAPAPEGGTMIFPPIVSTVTLLFAVVLSVYKPWGRVVRYRTAGDIS